MSINNNGIAKPTHIFRNLGNAIYVQELICTCHTAEPDTGGNIYCPAHGQMIKRNGVVKPLNNKLEL